MEVHLSDMNSTNRRHMLRYVRGLWIKEHASGTAGRRYAKAKCRRAERRLTHRQEREALVHPEPTDLELVIESIDDSRDEEESYQEYLDMIDVY